MMNKTRSVLAKEYFLRKVMKAGEATLFRDINIPKDLNVHRFELVDDNTWDFLYAVWGRHCIVDMTFTVKQPYAVGEHLYVKETWTTDDNDNVIYKVDLSPVEASKYKWKSALSLTKEKTRFLFEVMEIYPVKVVGEKGRFAWKITFKLIKKEDYIHPDDYHDILKKIEESGDESSVIKCKSAE